LKEKKGIGFKWIFAVVLVIIALFLGLIGFITDYLWFKELGYVSVFFTELFAKLKIGIPAFLVLMLLSVLYLMLLKRGYYKKVESNDVPNEKMLKLTALGYSALFSLIITVMVVSQLWFEILEFINSTDFNIADPLFGLDISFYIFKLDFITQLNEMMLMIIIAFVVLTVIYYMTLISVRKPQIFEQTPPDFAEEETYDSSERFTGNSPFGEAFNIFGKTFGMKTPPHRNTKPKKQFDDRNFMQLISIASKQLIVLGVIFFLMIAANFWLKQYDLLYSGTGVLYGAGYTDVNVTLWMYRILIALALIGAVGFVIGITKKNF